MNATLSVLDQQTQSTLEEQRAKLQAMLPTLAASGNTELYESVANQINSLSGEIASTAAKRVADAVAATETRASAALAPLQARLGMTQVLQSGGHYQAAAELTRTNLSSQNDVLRKQKSELEEERRTAEAEGNEGATAELTGKIETLNTTIETNNQTIKETATQMVTAMQQLATSMTQAGESAAQSGVSYLQKYGELYHVNTLPAQLELLKGNAGTLGKEKTSIDEGLTGMISSAPGVGPILEKLSHASGAEVFTLAQQLFNSPAFKELEPAVQQALENIVGSLENNTTATLENTKQILELEGKLLNPQTFSSSAFQLFRASVFTGMGGLLPSYAAPLGVEPSGNPAFTGAGRPEGEVHNGDKYFHTHIDTPLQVADPGHFGRAFDFSMKTPK